MELTTHLTIIGKAKHINGKPAVKCRCDCGSVVVLLERRVRTGKRRTCGCKMRTHGLTGTPEFNAYRSMVDRCANRKHKHYGRYGGRGISVCQEWLDDPRKFVEHIGPKPSKRHTVDRINNEGDYEPGNVRWASEHEQKRNTSRNRWIEAFGRRMVITDWSNETGLDPHLIRYRIETLGWPAEKALNPKRHRAGRPKKMLTFQGKTMCLADWAKQIGVTPAAITLRMKVTDSVAEILRPANPGIKLGESSDG